MRCKVSCWRFTLNSLPSSAFSRASIGGWVCFVWILQHLISRNRVSVKLPILSSLKVWSFFESFWCWLTARKHENDLLGIKACEKVVQALWAQQLDLPSLALRASYQKNSPLITYYQFLCCVLHHLANNSASFACVRLFPYHPTLVLLKCAISWSLLKFPPSTLILSSAVYQQMSQSLLALPILQVIPARKEKTARVANNQLFLSLVSFYSLDMSSCRFNLRLTVSIPEPSLNTLSTVSTPWVNLAL